MPVKLKYFRCCKFFEQFKYLSTMSGERTAEPNSMAEPGAARYGNFINYYQFNPTDKRLCHLPKDLLKSVLTEETNSSVVKEDPILCLDVGCNSGVRHL